MKSVQFLSNSPQVEQISRGLTLTRSLLVSSILLGEPYTGKKSLIRSLFPKAHFIDADQPQAVEEALQRYEEIVLCNYQLLKDPERYHFANKRIIAIADMPQPTAPTEERFAFIYRMPPLRERSEDIPLLTEHFCRLIREELMITSECRIEQQRLDLSENIKSLKASLYRQLVTADLDQEELEELIYAYLYPRIEGNNAYREHLALFERPLIKAGLKRYKSQLKLSAILGLNRNTLRKKIYEHHLD